MRLLRPLFISFIYVACCLTNQTNPPMFISLGCTSRAASCLKQAGALSPSPFNSLLTTDSRGLVSLLQDDFSYFLDKRYLEQDLHFNGITYRVINRYYNIDFRHDWHDIDDQFTTDLPNIQLKYEKLISSFRKLADYKGKVYFVRMAYPGDWVNPNYFQPTLFNDSTAIDYFQAKAIQYALEQKFPRLDFSLLIINHVEENTPDIAGLERVIEYKVRKMHLFDDFLKICKLLTN